MANMTERLLEDFQVAQRFGGFTRIRIDTERIKTSPPNSIQNRSISTRSR
jgi:hypothetical protein